MRPLFERWMNRPPGGMEFGRTGRPSRRVIYQVGAVILILVLLLALRGDGSPLGNRVRDGLAYVLTTEWDYYPVLDQVVNFGLQTVSVDSPLLDSLPYRPAPEAPVPPNTEVMKPTELPALPVSGRLLRGYGWTVDALDGMERFHPGVDIACPEGTEVKAVFDGKVEQVGDDDHYGSFVLLNHGGGTYTLYAQIQDVEVKKGDQVTIGQVLARTAAKGEVGEPGLHFEYREGAKLVDPLGKFSLVPEGDPRPAGS